MFDKEIPGLKLDIFSKLAVICPSDAILATNTSSISITKIAAAAKGAENRVLSTHFMNPVPVLKGVEIITGLQTSDGTLKRALEFMKAMGKISSTSKDSPGFLANRILVCKVLGTFVFVIHSLLNVVRDAVHQ